MITNEKIELSRNPNTSSDDLAKLANEDNDYILWYVALNSNTSSYTLEKLAKVKDNDIREKAIKENESYTRQPSTGSQPKR